MLETDIYGSLNIYNWLVLGIITGINKNVPNWTNQLKTVNEKLSK